MADISALRGQLLDAIEDNPPRNWSAAQLAAIVAVINAERVTDDIGNTVNGRPRLKVL